MKVIGFEFTKILAEKSKEFKQNSSLNTNIDFLNIEKEDISILKDHEAVKVSFKYSLLYSIGETKEKKKSKEQGKDSEITMEGIIIFSASPEESKEILKSWKKKELPNSFKIPLFNLILKKCTPKAVYLEEEINLPSHIPLPKITPKPTEESG